MRNEIQLYKGNFLHNGRKERSGIFQHFVHPRGLQNSTVRAIWTSYICLLERRVNKQRLQNVRFGLYDSAITFEGPEFHRGKVLANKIRSVWDTIVNHVKEVFAMCLSCGNESLEETFPDFSYKTIILQLELVVALLSPNQNKRVI